MHSLFSVCVNVYYTECRLFACMGELPAEGLPQVTELLPDFFAARHAVRAVPRINHVAHLGGTSPRDWQMKPCEWAANAAGIDHINLACQGLAFLPTYCAAWVLRSTADGPANISEASAGLFPLLTGREPPFEAALDWCGNSLIRQTWRGLIWCLRPLSSSCRHCKVARAREPCSLPIRTPQDIVS